MTFLRVSVAAMVLVGGIFATHSFRPKVAAGPHWPLREFPSDIGLSHSEDRPFETQVVRAIGADDYINRVYLGSTPPIELYIGYYKDQRSGDRIHSPKNCLPGSGWEPVHSSRVQIGSDERSSCSCERISGGTGNETEYGPLLVSVTWTDRCQRILG